MKFSVIVITSLLVFLSLFVKGQPLNDADSISHILQPNRVEFNAKSQEVKYYLINGEQEGLLVIQEYFDILSSSKKWVIEALDTALNSKWKSILKTPNNFTYSGYEYSANRYMMLFEERTYASNNYTAWAFDIPSGDTTTHKINTTFPIDLSEFETVGNTIILAGIASGRTVVMIYDLNTRKIKVQPGYYDPTLEILKIIPVDDDSTYLLVNRKDFAEKKRVITYGLIDQYGKKLRDYELPIDPEKSYTFGIPTIRSLDDGLLIGTFTRGKVLYDQGFYIKNIGDESKDINYVEFSELDKFFGYLPEKQENRLLRKRELKKAQGKSIRRNFNVNFSDIILTDDGCFYISEIYKAQYRNLNSYNPYVFNNSQRFFYGNRNDRTSTAKAGYEYSHAVIIKIDQEGKIAWDNLVDLDYHETKNLKNNVFSIPNRDGGISSLHMDKGIIRHQVSSADTVVTYAANLRLRQPDESIRYRDAENYYQLNRWFGRSFYLTGQQQVSRQKGRKAVHRRVFFINKISLPDQ